MVREGRREREKGYWGLGYIKEERGEKDYKGQVCITQRGGKFSTLNNFHSI